MLLRHCNHKQLYFCRFTKLGLLRLLTTASIMGEDVRTTRQAWKVYDRWLEDSRTGIRHEPFDFDDVFRIACRSVCNSASPKALADHWQPVMLLETTPV